MNELAKLKRLRTQLGLHATMLGVNGKEITVAQFCGLLDHFYDNPDEYEQFFKP